MESHGYEVASFSRTLKQLTFQTYAHLGAMPPEYYEQYPLARQIVLPVVNKTIVQLWIEEGMHRRKLDPYCWVNCERNAILPGKKYAYKDLRFPEEAAMVKEMGGICVKINRPGAESISEADLALNDFNGWDFQIHNTGSLPDYLAALAKAFKL